MTGDGFKASSFLTMPLIDGLGEAAEPELLARSRAPILGPLLEAFVGALNGFLPVGTAVLGDSATVLPFNIGGVGIGLATAGLLGRFNLREIFGVGSGADNLSFNLFNEGSGTACLASLRVLLK
jgi:hypothetical protein